MVLKTTDAARLAADLAERLPTTPVFDNDPCSSITPLRGDPNPSISTRWPPSCVSTTLPVAVRGGSPTQMEAAHAAGLVAAPRHRPPAPNPLRLSFREVVREVPVAGTRHRRDRQAPAFGPAGLCARRRPGGALAVVSLVPK